MVFVVVVLYGIPSAIQFRGALSTKYIVLWNVNRSTARSSGRGK